jgi:hypothetical protein
MRRLRPSSCARCPTARCRPWCGTPTDAALSRRRISGALLVWERGRWLHDALFFGAGHIRSCGSHDHVTMESPLTDVVVENLHTRVPRLLTPADGGSDPLTNGRYVAWRQCRATCHHGDQLVLYDTLSGRRTIVAPNGFSTATLNGDVLVWSIWNRTESSIHALDLVTRRQSLLTREIAPIISSRGARKYERWWRLPDCALPGSRTSECKVDRGWPMWRWQTCLLRVESPWHGVCPCQLQILIEVCHGRHSGNRAQAQMGPDQ